jgi:hypothetical protein
MVYAGGSSDACQIIKSRPTLLFGETDQDKESIQCGIGRSPFAKMQSFADGTLFLNQQDSSSYIINAEAIELRPAP